MNDPDKKLSGWSVEHGVMMGRRGHLWRSTWLSGPGIAWMTLLLVFPLVLLGGISFLATGPNGEILARFTTDNFARLGGRSPFGYDPEHLEVFIRSLFVGGVTTCTCMLGSIPLAFFLVTLNRHLQKVALVLLAVPLWTNVLFRSYAWQELLAPDGFVLHPFVWLGLLEPGDSIYPGWRALLTGMVSCYLPLMAVPVFTSVKQINWTHAEIARDLGADRSTAFINAILPQIQPGLVAGIIFVFLPATGQFVIPDLLGGGQTHVLGNALEEQFVLTRNWPLGAAYSVCMLCLVAIGLLVHARMTRNRQDREPMVL